MNQCTEAKVIVARKKHSCWYCGHSILPKEQCWTWTWFEDGKAINLWVHPECNAEWSADGYEEMSFAVEWADALIARLNETQNLPEPPTNLP